MTAMPPRGRPPDDTGAVSTGDDHHYVGCSVRTCLRPDRRRWRTWPVARMPGAVTGNSGVPALLSAAQS